MRKFTLRVGSRPSPLALRQTSIVTARLSALLPDLAIEIVPIRTSGDRMLSASLAQVGGKGLFIKEIEHALKERRIDLAVHSMKDLPARLDPAYRMVAVPEREEACDVLLSPNGAGIAELPPAARIGTSSARRRFQALRLNPALRVVPLRGNVDTRIAHLKGGRIEATILALAGLKRIGRLDEVKFVRLDETEFIPSGGQGALAVEALAKGNVGGSSEIEAAVSTLNDDWACFETTAEREFLATIGASCVTPVGVKATVADDSMTFRAILFSPDGREHLEDHLRGPYHPDSRPSSASAAGRDLGRRMLARGAGALLSDG